METMTDRRMRLTCEQIEKIRWRYAQPGHPTQRELAEEYGVHPSQVSRLVRGTSHVHLNGPVFPHRPTH